MMRAWVALLALMLAGGACASADTSPVPITSSGSPGSPRPTARVDGPTIAPSATTTTEPKPDPTATPAPLPEPAFDTAEEILAVLYERAQADQVVVSMLDMLGIGLYQADGTVIRAGAETADTDFFVYEPEARGLAELLKAHFDEDRWVPFGDFHAALADLGFQGSAEDLAAAYNAAYESAYEAPMAQFVYGLGGVDPDGLLHPMAPWLLVLDGFVPSNGRQAVASIGAFPMTAANHTSWGLARDRVQQLSPVPLEADPLVIAHLMSVVQSASVVVAATPGRAHEGHGSTGGPATITATVHAVASTLVSPFRST